MFLKCKLSMSIAIFSTVAICLGSCKPYPTTQPTESLPIVTTLTPSFIKTQTLLTIEPTSTIIPDEPGSYKASILISTLKNMSQEEVMKALLHKWLEYHKTSLVSEYLRLKDYKIENIKVIGYCPPPDKNTTKFLGEVTFSVQTGIAHPGDWIAMPGNISFGEDNWIYHLAPYVSVSAKNGIYTLDFEGVPPCN